QGPAASSQSALMPPAPTTRWCSQPPTGLDPSPLHLHARLVLLRHMAEQKMFPVICWTSPKEQADVLIKRSAYKIGQDQAPLATCLSPPAPAVCGGTWQLDHSQEKGTISPASNMQKLRPGEIK
ncbi:T0139750 isoform 2, partial [Pan troglodytes]